LVKITILLKVSWAIETISRSEFLPNWTPNKISLTPKLQLYNVIDIFSFSLKLLQCDEKIIIQSDLFYLPCKYLNRLVKQ
jgi:hypothetical protein